MISSHNVVDPALALFYSITERLFTVGIQWILCGEKLI